MKNIQNNGYCLSSIGRFIKLAGIIMILLVFSIIFVPFSNAQLTANSTEVQQQVQQQVQQLLQQQKELLTQLSLREVEPQVQQQLDIVSNVTSLTPDQQKQVMQSLQQVTSSPPITIPLPP
jgi:predicted PurR-regulated permease PerM